MLLGPYYIYECPFCKTKYKKITLKSGNNFGATSWTDGGSTFTNSGLVQFPQCTGGNNTITHFALCTLASGGEVVVSGALNASLNISSGIQPQFSSASLSVGAD